jgi:hypothetical protein
MRIIEEVMLERSSMEENRTKVVRRLLKLSKIGKFLLLWSCPLQSMDGTPQNKVYLTSILSRQRQSAGAGGCKDAARKAPSADSMITIFPVSTSTSCSSQSHLNSIRLSTLHAIIEDLRHSCQLIHCDAFVFISSVKVSLKYLKENSMP